MSRQLALYKCARDLLLKHRKEYADHDHARLLNRCTDELTRSFYIERDAAWTAVADAWGDLRAEQATARPAPDIEFFGSNDREQRGSQE